MTHVLMADMWTRGLPHIAPLRAAPDVRVTLFHHGSLAGECAPGAEGTRDGVMTRDYRWYGPRDFPGALDVEDPDIVLKLTFYYPYDAAHFKTCRLRGIPSMYLAHGSMHLSDLNNPTLVPHRLSVGRPVELMRKARKWAYHFRSGWQMERAFSRSTGAPNPALRRAVSSLVKGRHAWFNQRKAADELPDVAAVYGAADVRQLERSGFEAAKVQAIGYPQLDRAYHVFHDPDRKAGIRQAIGVTDQRILTYYTGDYSGRTRVSRSAYRSYLRELVDIVQMSDWRLVIKVHPAEDAQWYQSFVEDDALVFQDDVDSFELLGAADAVVGEVTTLVPLALYLGQPVAYLDLFDVGFVSFNGLAERYGIGVSTWDDFRVRLASPQGWGARPSGADALEAIGPVDGRASDRLVNLVQSTARR